MIVRRPAFRPSDRTLRGWFPGLAVAGLASVAVYIGMAWLSHAFVYGSGHAERPIVVYLLLYAAAFALYVVAVWRVTRPAAGAVPLLPIIVFGVLFRGVLLCSEPIQEDDFYRYLWDGKVVASGLNPYRFTPREVSVARDDERRALQAYRAVADDGFAHVLARVNHPHLPTVYPPLAQAAFGLAAGLVPGSLTALRVGFLLLDLGIVAALVGLLRRLERPVGWVLIYAWSPLVIKETVNSAHYDVLPTLFVMLAVLASLHGRFLLAHAGVGFATLGKLFPVLLMPLCLAYTWRRHGAYAAAGGLALTCLVVAGGYLPFAAAGNALWHGAGAFAEEWRTNSLAFPVVQSVVGERWLANGLAAGGVAVAVLIGLRRAAGGTADALPRGCFLVIGTLLLLSPVGNPWYYVWAMPFVCLFPRASWLCLSGLLGLYYLGFAFLYRGQPETVGWITCVEYLPFYGLLLWEVWRVRRGRPVPFGPGAAFIAAPMGRP